MAPFNALSPSILCAENIALLHFLHVVPAQPSSRDVRQFISKGSKSDSIRLPLEQEAQLTSTLSLLSALREDVNRVTAVAVRELPHPATLEVLIAVNKATQTAGDSYLQEIKATFELYFRILSNATNVFDSALDLRLFRQILICCQDRILSRLRFKKHKRGKQKPAIEESLRLLLNALLPFKSETTHSLIQETRKLIVSLNSLSNHRVTEELIKVVENAYTWNQVEDMSNLFKSIPAKALATDIYPTLRTIIGKVGQYRTAATILYHLARHFPIVRDPEVTTVKLPKAAFPKVALSSYAPSLDVTLQRVEGSRYLPGILPRLCKIIGRTPEECQSAFVNSIYRTLQESKIHAEVQILTYSLRKVAAIPRLVQSNKKACFLCNAFLMIARGPGILKSHGKLYNTWRLPLLAGMKDLQIGLNSVLEDQARDSICKLVQKKRKIGFPEPCESSALSSAISKVSGHAAHVPYLESSSREHQQESSTSLQAEDEPTVANTTGKDGVQSSLCQAVAGICGDQSSPKLRATSLDAGQISMVYQTRSSKLWLEYTVGLRHPRPGEPLIYGIRSLGIDEALNLRNKRAGEIQDVASMEPGSEIVLPLKSSYLIDCGDGIVELRFGRRHRPGTPPVDLLTTDGRSEDRKHPLHHQSKR